MPSKAVFKNTDFCREAEASLKGCSAIKSSLIFLVANSVPKFLTDSMTVAVRGFGTTASAKPHMSSDGLTTTQGQRRGTQVQVLINALIGNYDLVSGKPTYQESSPCGATGARHRDLKGNEGPHVYQKWQPLER